MRDIHNSDVCQGFWLSLYDIIISLIYFNFELFKILGQLRTVVVCVVYAQL